MLTNRETLLCRYHYDPVDRLVDCTPSAQAITRRFYLKDRLATEIQGAVQRSIMQHDDQLLAEQQRQSGTVDTRLLATDQQRSVLTMVDASSPRFFAYTPYGHRPLGNGLLSLLGFNGERPDSVTGCYLLGNGYRAFNPVLMRFNSPDSWSPFGEGGLNAYAYCVGDPVNRADPTGHSNFLVSFLKGVGNRVGIRTPRHIERHSGEANNSTAFRNPLARQANLPNSTISSERMPLSGISRSSASSESSRKSASTFTLDENEELPPSFKNIFPETELKEPGIGFRFEQAISRAKSDLDYLEILMYDPAQRPALNVIQHDIREVNNRIRKLYSYHDEATLPPYRNS